MELNIHHLTLAKIAQVGRHDAVTEELGSKVESPLEVTFFAEFIML